MRRIFILLAVLCAAVRPVAAQDITINGLADFRLIAPPSDTSHLEGGYGKFRWGDGRGSPVIPDLAALALRVAATVTPDLRIVAQFRYDPKQKTALDMLEAYVRYRPVSTSNWRWSVRGGAFFPPVSLENSGVGWTPEWTLTPSAINSWVGEELRVIGAEGTLEWRGEVDRFEFVAAAFGVNDGAGESIDDYGWTLNDRAIGLFDHIRTPNPGGPPTYNYQFRQLDHAVGWYAGVNWERPDLGRISFLRYDNGADPSAHDDYEFGWRTSFWSLGWSTEIGPVTILAQGLTGTTSIAPSPSFVSRTDFWSYFVLAGIERGTWRFAVRFDQFATSETSPSPPPRSDEHGIAGTAAATWSPLKWLSLTGEVAAIDSARSQRALIGKAPHTTAVQAQLALRLRF